jgi:hypothetical protein
VIWTLTYFSFILFGKKEDSKNRAFFAEIDSETRYPKPFFDFSSNEIMIKISKFKESI